MTPINHNARLAGVAALAALVALHSPATQAATKTWDGGGGDSLWSNARNWSNDTLPASGDTILLDAPVTIRLDIDHVIDAGGEIRTTAGFGFGVFVVESGVTLTARRLDFGFGFVENNGSITTPGSGLLLELEVGTFFSNEGSLTRAFATIGRNATFDNRFGTVSDSTLRLSTGSNLVNFGTLDEVSITTGLGSGATITNEGDIPHLRGLFLGNADDRFDNNGLLVNRGDAKNRGTFDNAGTLDNRARFFNECTSTTANATPAVFINTGVLAGNAVQTTCRIWDNDSGNRLWSNPVNWSGNAVPTGDDLVVIANVAGTASAPILDTDFEIRNELIVHAFSILSVRPAQTLLNNGVVTVRGGALLVDGAFRNRGDMTYSGSAGGTGNLSVFGSFENDGSGFGNFLSGSSLFNGGLATNTGGNDMTFADGSAFNNTATFTNNGRVDMTCGVDFRNTGILPGNRFVGLCKRWDGGGGDSRWSTPENWDDDSLPQGSDSILLDVNGTVRLDVDYTMASGGSLSSGPGFLFGVFVIESGATLRARNLTLDYGFIDNAGTIRDAASGVLVGLRVGTLFVNRGSMTRLFADIGTNGIFDNRFATVTDSTFRLETGARLNNLGTLDDVSVTTGIGSGGTIVNDGAMTDLRSLWVGNSADRFDNNGTVVNTGNAFNRGTIENGGSYDTTAGSTDNQGVFVAECDSTLLGTLDGHAPVIEPCDVTPPALDVSGPLTFEATSATGARIAYSVSALDDVDGVLTPVCNPPNTAIRNLGVHHVTCSATDAAGNTGMLEFDVSVVDTTPPALTAPGDVDAEATGERTVVDTGLATATDFYPVTVTHDAPAGGFPLGNTVITWRATDSSGNEATATQAVRVADTTPPVIVVPGDVSTEAAAVLTPVDIGTATATDHFAVTIGNDAPAVFPLGTTLVTWTATDDNGNSASGLQSVTVVDTTPPELSVPADVVAEANAVSSTIDIGAATASDIFEVAITSDAPATYPLGTTIVTWTATDGSGNRSTGSQAVTVVDTTPPELAIPDDVTVVAAGLLTPVDIGVATATDIFDVSVSHDAPPAGFPVGVTAVTWRAEDANGNVSTAVQLVRAEYAFGGFEAPLQEGGLYKRNRTIPVKFQLRFADGSAALTATAVLQLQLLVAGELDGDPIDASASGNANEGNLFRTTGDSYIFNLSTRPLEQGIYRLFVILDDGSRPRTIDIGLK